MPLRPNATLRRLLRAPAAIYRLRLGWLLGNRFLMLVHTGRRAGQPRRTVLEVLRYRKEIPEWTIMCAFGRNADWLRNIEAHQHPTIVVDSRRFTAAWRFLGEEEAAAAIADYERRNRFMAPVVRAGVSWLAGWRYDASDAARRRLAAQMPYVAFSPKP